jgi:alpha-L-fucosidase
MEPKYLPAWNSLRVHPTPQWFRDSKFGIYTHWGIYSVPAYGPNVTWYPYNMYWEGTPQYEHHLKTYGHPSKFGYKDFIPMFTAEKFDPDEWADLFKRLERSSPVRWASTIAFPCGIRSIPIGARQRWAQAKCGSRVGESHTWRGHAFHDRLAHMQRTGGTTPTSEEFDTSDPRYTGLYGQPTTRNGRSKKPRAAMVKLEWEQQGDLQDRAQCGIPGKWLGKTKDAH